MPESSLVMMALGAFRFGILAGGYQSLRRQAAFRWHSADRIGRQPALQYLGPGAQTIALQGVIYPHFKGGLRQVELMRLAAGQGAPMMLVDGLGWVFDRWSILGVMEAKSVFLPDGAPRLIEFGIELAAYGADAVPA